MTCPYGGPRQSDLLAKHQALEAKAREHKRKVAEHRQAARDCREKQREIEVECHRLGIQVITSQPDGTPAANGGGKPHGRKRRRRRHPRSSDAH